MPLTDMPAAPDSWEVGDQSLQRHAWSPLTDVDGSSSKRDAAAAAYARAVELFERYSKAQPGQAPVAQRGVVTSSRSGNATGSPAAGAAVQQACCSNPSHTSLQSRCLAVLGRELPDLLEAAQQHPGGLSWLPPDIKASLLAVARRRQDVSFGAALAALCDSSWRTLDVSGTAIPPATLLAAAQQLPDLRCLDVTGCAQLSSHHLQQLAHACPRLEVLRLGGSQALSAAAAEALPSLLPRLKGAAGAGGQGPGAAAAAAAPPVRAEVLGVSSRGQGTTPAPAAAPPPTPAQALGRTGSAAVQEQQQQQRGRSRHRQQQRQQRRQEAGRRRHGTVVEEQAVLHHTGQEHQQQQQVLEHQQQSVQQQEQEQPPCCSEQRARSLRPPVTQQLDSSPQPPAIAAGFQMPSDACEQQQQQQVAEGTGGTGGSGEASCSDWEALLEEGSGDEGAGPWGPGPAGAASPQQKGWAGDGPRLGTGSSCSRSRSRALQRGGGCHLQRLQALVWRDVSLQSVAVVLERCPRVVVLPLLERQLVARGQVEVPGWWRAGQPLDEEAWLRVGPGALLPAEVGTAAQPNYTGPSLAEKFKQAYVEQDERLLQVALKTEAYQMRRALESSGGRRVLETWLDEL